MGIRTGNPSKEGPAVDRMLSYIWRGEGLGTFGEILSPYDRDSYIPLMEPVLLRNYKNAQKEIMEVFGSGKSPLEAVNEFVKRSVVIYGQAEKSFNNIKHPYVTNYKQIKTFT